MRLPFYALNTIDGGLPSTKPEYKGPGITNVWINSATLHKTVRIEYVGFRIVYGIARHGPKHPDLVLRIVMISHIYHTF